jgi:hydroxybutyrate-dimer hydrolase
MAPLGPLNGTTRKTRYNRGDVTTIAASVSNGGGASLAAAEQDTQGWITAVVVGEPQINLRVPSQVSVSQGGCRRHRSAGRLPTT